MKYKRRVLGSARSIKIDFGETVMVGNSYREGIMDVYKVDKKHGIITRRDSTWAEIDSWQMLYITTIRTFRRPCIEMFEYFK